MFNLVHLFRTLMGIVQINAFVEWCEHAFLCLHVVMNKHYEKPEPKRVWLSTIKRRIGRALTFLVYSLIRFMMVISMINLISASVEWFKRKLSSVAMQRKEEEEEEEEEEYYNPVVSHGIERILMVNNTVIDNELGGRDVTVVPSIKKIWEGLKEGMLQPRRCLSTEQVELCTIRWTAAYLCAMDAQWGVDPHDVDPDLLKWFFSDDMGLGRLFLNYVTWCIGKDDEDSNAGLFSLRCLDPFHTGCDLTAAYNGDMRYCRLYYSKRYSFEFDSLVSSYPGQNSDITNVSTNRERVALGLVYSVMLAKYMGVEKLKRVRDYYDRYHVPYGKLLHQSFKLFLSNDPSYETEYKLLSDNNEVFFSVPIFPYKMQTVALWEESTNWRVMQASAHADIYESMRDPDSIASETHLFDDEKRIENVFESCSDLGRNTENTRRPLGIVIETVRTFLAEWVVAASQVPEWEPEIPLCKFELYSKNKIFTYPNDDDDYEAIHLWVCLNTLQQHVAKSISSDGNLPSNHALIMMLVMGFPLIEIENVSATILETQRSSDGEHDTLNVSEKLYKLSSTLAPQNISVIIRENIETRLISLQLENNGEETRFFWQKWVDAALGYLSGLDQREAENVVRERAITKADLNGAFVELCPLYVDKDGCVLETGAARMWEGWPAFDSRFCKFEVDQWLTACNVSLDPSKFGMVDSESEYSESSLGKELEELPKRVRTILENAEEAITVQITSRSNKKPNKGGKRKK